MSRSFGLCAAALCLFAGCASGVTETRDEILVHGAYALNPERPWNKIADSFDGARTRGDILTRDGVALNMIRVVGGLGSGDYIAKPIRRETPTPIYKSSMTDAELVVFLADTLSALGYEQIETTDVRPQPFGKAPGIGMGLTATTPRGLRIKGDARLARSGKNLNVMVFMAPEAHFYAAYAEEVERLFASARLK